MIKDILEVILNVNHGNKDYNCMLMYTQSVKILQKLHWLNFYCTFSRESKRAILVEFAFVYSDFQPSIYGQLLHIVFIKIARQRQGIRIMK